MINRQNLIAVKNNVKTVTKLSRKKDSGKSKNTQNGTRKQCDKKLNTLGGYAGRVMVGDRRQPICIPAGNIKGSG